MTLTGGLLTRPLPSSEQATFPSTVSVGDPESEADFTPRGTSYLVSSLGLPTSGPSTTAVLIEMIV